MSFTLSMLHYSFVLSDFGSSGPTSSWWGILLSSSMNLFNLLSPVGLSLVRSYFAKSYFSTSGFLCSPGSGTKNPFTNLTGAYLLQSSKVTKCIKKIAMFQTKVSDFYVQKNSEAYLLKENIVFYIFNVLLR